MSTEENRIWRELKEAQEQIVELKSQVVERREFMKETIETAVESAVKAAMPKTPLTDDEHRWIQLAIQSEAQSIAFRRAVIEKSLTGLVWALIVGIGMVLREYFTAHGWKP